MGVLSLFLFLPLTLLFVFLIGSFPVLYSFQKRLKEMLALYEMLSHKIPFWMLLVVEACSAMKESMVNLSCHSLETVDGNFKYPIDGNVIEFDISLQDKTKIGLWIKNESLEFDEKLVKAMDSTSFTLHQCHNLTLYKLYPKNEEETMYYHMAADEKTPAEQHEIPPWAMGVIVCTLALVVGLLVWCCRKNRILDRICDQREEDQAKANGRPEDHSEQKPFLHPDPGKQIQEGLEEYVVNMDEQEPGQDFGEEGKCKPAEKGNAEQTVSGMLEHGDGTTRDVVSGDAVEAHSPQDDPLVVPNKEETRSEHSHSCGVSKTSGKGKRDNTKNSG